MVLKRSSRRDVTFLSCRYLSVLDGSLQKLKQYKNCELGVTHFFGEIWTPTSYKYTKCRVQNTKYLFFLFSLSFGGKKQYFDVDVIGMS